MTKANQVRPDLALVHLMMGFHNAVLSMQLRRWLLETDEPRQAPIRPMPPSDAESDEPTDDRGDGGAGASVPRRPRPGPFQPPAEELEEPDSIAHADLPLGVGRAYQARETANELGPDQSDRVA